MSKPEAPCSLVTGRSSMSSKPSTATFVVSDPLRTVEKHHTWRFRLRLLWFINWGRVTWSEVWPYTWQTSPMSANLPQGSNKHIDLSDALMCAFPKKNLKEQGCRLFEAIAPQVIHLWPKRDRRFWCWFQFPQSLENASRIVILSRTGWPTQHWNSRKTSEKLQALDS